MGIFDKLFGGGKPKTPPTPPKPQLPDAIKEKYFDNHINEFATGKFASHFPNTNVMLKKGEHLVFDCADISLCEERSVKMKGNHKGFSVRIAKGLSYRFGTFEGATEQKVVELDMGNLILTNKRIIFSGDTKSVEYPLSKIVTIEPLEDGIMVNRSGKTKVEYFVNTTNLTLKTEVSPDEDEDFETTWIEYSMTGFELKKLIQTLIQQ